MVYHFCFQAAGTFLWCVAMGPNRHKDIIYRCHIHRPSIVALQSGRRIDSEAVETGSYNTLEGALATLIAECNVEGIQAKHDEPDLFDGN